MSSGFGLDRVIVKPSDRRPLIVDAIHGARESIRLSMFRCTDFEVLNALAAARRRGVSVRLLLTQRVKGSGRALHEVGQHLSAMGAAVTRYALAQVKYHAKYLVVDDSLAVVGSANLTEECFEKTADFLLRTVDPAVVASLARLFDQDVIDPAAALPAGWSPRLIVGPDITRARFAELFGQTRERLHIVDHRVTDSGTLAFLREREREGLEIRIYGRHSMRKITPGGAKRGLRSHGKMMILDGRRAVLGSISLSPAGLGVRRELAILTEDPGCLAVLEKFLTKAGAPARLKDLTPRVASSR